MEDIGMEESIAESLTLSSLSTLSLNSCSTELSIVDFPKELLHEIFYHLDGISLMRCKLVCKTWKDNINYLEKKENFWYRNCHKDIASMDQLLDIIDNTYTCHWLSPNYVDWEVIYKSWHMWCGIEGSTPTVKKLVSGLSGISCVKVSGGYLLISTCEGGGRLLAINFGTTKVTEIYRGGSGIINFELVNNYDSCNLLKDHRRLVDNTSLGALNNELEFFSNLAHNEIWLEVKESYIKLTKNNYTHVDKVKQRIRHSLGNHIRLVEDLQLFFISRNVCKKLIMPNGFSKIIDFWHEIYTLEGNTDHNCIYRNSACNRKPTVIKPKINVSNSHIYSWHGSVIVICSPNRHVEFCAGDQRTDQVTPIRKGLITSVLMYAKYLFLGTDRGDLLIYCLDNPENCVNIVIYKTPAWTINIGYTQIFHISVAEPFHHGGIKPMIICASTEDVYQISFPPDVQI